MLKSLALLLCALLALPARADGISSLENFIRDTRSGRADFTQVVTSPARPGETAREKTSSGTFEFLRPGRFRFVYRKPFEQTIVADGHTLWLYDVDLNQVTSRDQAAALGSTPAALIASAADLTALRKDFDLAAAPAQAGLDWVEARPKKSDGPLQLVRVGFRGNALATLEILDSFGQRSTLRFSNFESNPRLDPASFEFQPPAGADVLRQ